MEILKISSKSNPNSVAGAIAGLVKESNKAEMQAIGAGALNQAVKAVAIARGFVAPAGVDLICIPAFAEVEASDNSTNITSERKRVTKQNPHNYCRTCNKHSCKHCVKDIFSSYKTSIEKCECWGHQENQCGTYDYKADTSAVHKTSLLKINFRK